MDYFNPAQAFKEGYAATEAVSQDIASQDILKQAYAASPEDAQKSPEGLQNIYNQAAAMSAKAGYASVAHEFTKQSSELGKQAGAQQLAQVKATQGKLEMASQLAQTATTPEQLIEAVQLSGADPKTQQYLLKATSSLPFEKAKQVILKAGNTYNENLTAQNKALEAQLKIHREQRLDEQALSRERLQAAQTDKLINALGGGAGTVKLSSADVARSQRGINATGNIASSLEALNEFSSGTTTGFLPELQSAKGMTSAVQAAGVRGLSGTEANQMNTIFTGIGRSLAAVETGGLATGLAELSKKMESGIYIKPGDSPKAVALKLADIRRITEESLRPAIDSEMLTPKQIKTAEQLLQRVEKAVPYTTIDVIKATRKEGGKTVGQVSKEIGVPQFKGTGTKEDPIKLDD